MFKHLSRNILLSLCFAVSLIPVHAFDVDLKRWTFHSTTKKHLPMYITNPEDVPLAVQIKIYTRSFDEAGLESLTGIYPGIEVLPANVIVDAESKELVTLLWTEEMLPAQEIPLRVVVTQLPIDFNNGSNNSSSLKMMYESVKPLYIKPPNSYPDIKLLSYEWNKETQILNILVENRGTASLFTKYWRLKINDDITLYVYSYKNNVDDKIFGYTPQANFLAGERRKIPIQIITNSTLTNVNKVELIKIYKD